MNRQQRHYQKQKEAGLVRKNVWVHESKLNEFESRLDYFKAPRETEGDERPQFLRPQNF